MFAIPKKQLPFIILLLFAVPLYFINIHTTHSWGDDFAQYIKEAQNIAHGKPYYQSNYIFNKYNPVYAPPQYPPGFPLLLAPVVKYWGLSIRAMCYFNSFIATCVLFALYAFFRKQMSAVSAVCLSLLVIYSGFMLDLKSSVLADVPCLLFVTLYLAFRHSQSFSWQRITLLVLLLTMAMQTRSQSIFLLPAEALFALILFIKLVVQGLKDRSFDTKKITQRLLPPIAIIAGTLVVRAILEKLLATPNSTTTFYNTFMDDAMKLHLGDVIDKYADYLFKTLPAFFHYETYNGYFRAFILAARQLVTAAGIIGFAISIRERLAVDDIFFAIMCLLIMFYPVPDPRYFLPAVPILYYYCFRTCKYLLPAIAPIKPQWVVVALTTCYLLIGSGYIRGSMRDESVPGTVPMEKDVTAFNYIKQHVGPNDVIVFAKPRLLTLYTDKKSVNSAWYISPERNKQIFDSLNAKYILIVDGLEDGFFKEYLKNIQRPVDSARIAEGYTLYKLR